MRRKGKIKERYDRFVRDIYYSNLGSVSWVQNCPTEVVYGKSIQVILIGNQIYFGHTRLDQDLPFPYVGQLCTQLSAPTALRNHCEIVY